MEKKLLKRIGVGVLVLVVLAGAGLEVLSRIYQEKAGAFFREKFTKQSDLILKPFQTTVSVWTHFPRVTFNLHNLALVDTSGRVPVQVLGIKRAEIAIPLGQFNLQKLKISRVDLIDVLFHQRIDSAGHKIGLKFKQIENPDTTGSALPFRIPKLRLRNAQIISENYYKESSFSLLLQEADLTANMADQKLTIKGQVSGKVGKITSRKIVLFTNQPFAGQVNYDYLLNQKKGTIYNTALEMNQSKISLAGSHTTLAGGAGANLNLKIAGNQPLLYLLTQLMPPQAKTFLSHVETKSKMQFSLHITGQSSPTIRPRNLIKFALKNGRFYLPKSKTEIRQVQLVGQMDNGLKQSPETSQLRIFNFSALTHEDSFRVALKINNFVKPSFVFRGKGRMHLTELAEFVKLPFTTITKGSIIGEVALSGSLPDSLHPETPNWRGNGSVLLQQATFRPVGLKVNCEKVNGGIGFRDNVLEMKALHGTIGGHPFKLQASIENFLAYLFDQPGAIKANANLYAARLDTDWLDKKAGAGKNKDFKKSKKKTKPDSGDSFRQYSLQNIQSQVALKVDKLNLPLNKQINNLTVLVNQKNEHVRLNKMRFTSTGGGLALADGGFTLHQDGFHSPFLNVQLNYPSLDFQAFMQNLTAIQEMKKKPASAKIDKTKDKSKPQFLEQDDYRLNLQVKARNIKYLHLKGNNLVLKANINGQRVKIAQLDLGTSGGVIHIKGEMELDAPDNRYPVKLRTEMRNINLQQLFTMAENMQLDVLSSRNIKGTVECNVTVLTTLDKTFSPSIDQTIAYARATFRNMELIDVLPLQNALKMIKKERTGHLYFEDVTTNFLLKDNQFLTPGLRMNSNLTAFNLSGTYTMGGGANLNMDVGVMNVLLGNNKRRIEKIQAGDTTDGPNFQNKQHISIIRDQLKYKVRLSNKKVREEKALAIKQQFRNTIRQHQIDTVFTMK